MGRDGWHSNLAVELVQVYIPNSYFDSNNKPTIYARQPNPTIYARKPNLTQPYMLDNPTQPYMLEHTLVCYGDYISTGIDVATTTVYHVLQQQLCVIDTVLQILQ